MRYARTPGQRWSNNGALLAHSNTLAAAVAAAEASVEADYEDDY